MKFNDSEPGEEGCCRLLRLGRELFSGIGWLAAKAAREFGIGKSDTGVRVLMERGGSGDCADDVDEGVAGVGSFMIGTWGSFEDGFLSYVSEVGCCLERVV